MDDHQRRREIWLLAQQIIRCMERPTEGALHLTKTLSERLLALAAPPASPRPPESHR